MISSLVSILGFWSWFVLGVVLLAVEVLVPGTFLLWLGIAAILTGIIAVVIALTWQSQLIVFAVLSVLAVIGWWFWSGGSARPRGKEPVLHRSAELHVGRVFTLQEPIVQGQGRVHIDDSIWRVSGPDLPAGARVRVESADGAVLLVVEA
jgi:membrane protein implicated in regulation of membrane protease activity